MKKLKNNIYSTKKLLYFISIRNVEKTGKRNFLMIRKKENFVKYPFYISFFQSSIFMFFLVILCLKKFVELLESFERLML
jgi:hypothetical protein